MKCQGCDRDMQGRPDRKFCSDKCRIAHWMILHPRKGSKPKRIRSRERDRLYTIIHRGETLEQLREQARRKIGKALNSILNRSSPIVDFFHDFL